MKIQPIGLILGCCFLILSCNRNPKKDLFKFVDASRSHIEFANTIIENDSVNPTDCLNCFNGGGTGIGDFNNDGLSDIVFTGNQVSSALYLNKGSLVFEDISLEANFKTDSWVTGVSIVDINADGLDDIYLNVAGVNCDNNCPNLLFINQGLNQNGIPTFIEQAEAYGLNDPNYATQAVFFDYDMDDDLDVYIVHNKNSIKFNRNFPRPKDVWPDFLQDYLLKNETREGIDHPVFVNVSEELNIIHKGFGLGVGITDFNDDQLIDIYVSNDFITEDFLYINKAHHDSLNPGFEELNKKYLGHTTTNGMGMDIGDINNDGLWDIFVLDMFPNSYNRQKRVQGKMSYAEHMNTRNMGYSAQYMRNTMQLTNGHLNGEPLKSSEVGLFYGISSTDWSWAPLMLDFDNDGDKDIYITNGYIKDVIDRDYINFMSQTNNTFSKNGSLEKYLKDLPSIKEPNFFYEQKNPDEFEDVSNTWIDAVPSLSNGVAYADFDLDGDLDMVVSNINSKAFLLENKTTSKLENHYLRIKLNGDPKNKDGIGSKVTLWNKGREQHYFQSVIRGYLSSVDPVVHFGVTGTTIDSLQIIWPNGNRTFVKNLQADQLLEVSFDSSEPYKKPQKNQPYTFRSADSLLDFTHIENLQNEFFKQQMLMRQYSRSGPCLAAADIDGEPGDEIFIGGSFNQAGSVWFQDASGQYYPRQLLDSIYEDTDAIFIDVDNDKDLDLYVSSGGTEFSENSPNYADRIYLNNGAGEFSLSTGALPELYASNACVRAIDIDHDGDLDLFIGGRITPDNYPKTPESSILINNNGVYKKHENNDLSNLGMVTDAIWSDIDSDGWEDLLVVGEFMPIRVFKNHEGVLKKMSLTWLDKDDDKITTEGWWNCIEASDFDKDGDMDFVIGNQGLNGYVKPSKNYPVYVYNQDFDKDGRLDPLLGQYFDFEGKKTLFPIHTKDDIKRQYPETVIHFYSYEEFAKITFKGLLKIEDLESETLKATTFESSYVENLGGGIFKVRSLPSALQLSPVNDFLVSDFDEDGQTDILAVGNDFSAESNYGQFDALTGLFIKTNGTDFEVIPSRNSGFYVPGQSNHMIKITDKRGRDFVVSGQNNDRLKIFEFNR